MSNGNVINHDDDDDDQEINIIRPPGELSYLPSSGECGFLADPTIHSKTYIMDEGHLKTFKTFNELYNTTAHGRVKY